MTLDDETRAKVFAAVERHSIPEPNSGCWIWLGCVSDMRRAHRFWRAKFRIGRKSHTAARLVYAAHNDGVPDSLWVLHRCDNPLCVNPDHLWLGTASDNSRDSIRKNRRVRIFRPDGRGGVYPTSNGRFRCQFRRFGKITHVGTFNTREEAAAALSSARHAAA